jgi:hypothetical protein
MEFIMLGFTHAGGSVFVAPRETKLQICDAAKSSAWTWLWLSCVHDTTRHMTWHDTWHDTTLDTTLHDTALGTTRHLTWHNTWHDTTLDTTQHLTRHVMTQYLTRHDTWHDTTLDKTRRSRHDTTLDMTQHLTRHLAWHDTWHDTTLDMTRHLTRHDMTCSAPCKGPLLSACPLTFLSTLKQRRGFRERTGFSGERIYPGRSFFADLLFINPTRRSAVRSVSLVYPPHTLVLAAIQIDEPDRLISVKTRSCRRLNLYLGFNPDGPLRGGTVGHFRLDRVAITTVAKKPSNVSSRTSLFCTCFFLQNS